MSKTGMPNHQSKQTFWWVRVIVALLVDTEKLWNWKDKTLRFLKSWYLTTFNILTNIVITVIIIIRCKSLLRPLHATNALVFSNTNMSKTQADPSKTSQLTGFVYAAFVWKTRFKLGISKSVIFKLLYLMLCIGP